MKLAHAALWTTDLDAAAAFWEELFGATVGEPYRSQRRPGFVSRFVRLRGDAGAPQEEGARIELMTGPWISADPPPPSGSGWDHIAISLGSRAAVDALAGRCRERGCLVAEPRTTGDGFYEAIVAMPDGTPVEITD